MVVQNAEASVATAGLNCLDVYSLWELLREVLAYLAEHSGSRPRSLKVARSCWRYRTWVATTTCALPWGMGQVEGRTVVPSLVGLAAVVAHDVALDAHLLAVDQDPSHSPTVAGVVAAQEPVAGSPVAPGHRVRIWVQTNPGEEGRGGGGLPVPSGPTPLTAASTK